MIPSIIITISIIILHSVFKPHLDKTLEGDVLLWYTGLFERKRKFIKIY